MLPGEGNGGQKPGMPGGSRNGGTMSQRDMVGVTEGLEFGAGRTAQLTRFCPARVEHKLSSHRREARKSLRV